MSSSDPVIARHAAHFMDNYEFPVMMMIVTPNGEIVSKINANKFAESPPEEVDSIFDFG